MLFFVYLDDILMVGTQRFVTRAVRRAMHRLKKVGFIISQKPKTEPARHVDFVGKIFDLESGTVENIQGMLRGLMKLWFVLVLGSLNRQGMGGLLARLERALHPAAGLSPFLGVCCDSCKFFLP